MVLDKGSPPRMRGKPITQNRATAKRRITPADAGKTLPQKQHGTETRDHPRGCGENRVTSALLCMPRGSPPRMRGKPPLFACHQSPHSDHPRGCGENRELSFATVGGLGSPPRMRGKPFQRGFNFGCQGITPADAGKTRFPSVCMCFAGDHPRGCGENQP